MKEASGSSFEICKICFAKPMIGHHGVQFFKDPDRYEVGDFLHDAPKKRLKAPFDVIPTELAAVLVAQAQAELQESINAVKAPCLARKGIQLVVASDALSVH